MHHPDKVKGSPEEKQAAQEKFVAIQQAYEKLSTLKKQRAKANKKSEKEEVQPGGDETIKVELWSFYTLQERICDAEKDIALYYVKRPYAKKGWSLQCIILGDVHWNELW